MADVLNKLFGRKSQETNNTHETWKWYEEDDPHPFGS